MAELRNLSSNFWITAVLRRQYRRCQILRPSVRVRKFICGERQQFPRQRWRNQFVLKKISKKKTGPSLSHTSIIVFLLFKPETISFCAGKLNNNNKHSYSKLKFCCISDVAKKEGSSPIQTCVFLSCESFHRIFHFIFTHFIEDGIMNLIHVDNAICWNSRHYKPNWRTDIKSQNMY